MNFIATKAAITGQGSPPDSFLAQLIAFGMIAPDYLFAVNALDDIYGVIQPILAPNGWTSLAQRRAGLLEAMRVDAGHESTWNWNEGHDPNGEGEADPEDQEAGIFQVSHNSTSFDVTLSQLVAAHCDGINNPQVFQAAMKADHLLALHYCAWAWRFNWRWSGPFVHGIAQPDLSIASMNEIQALILSEAS